MDEKPVDTKKLEPTYFSFEKLPVEHLPDSMTRRMVTGEKIMFTQNFIKKGTIIPEHEHLNEQISYIISGVVKFTINGEEKIVRAGEGIVIPADLPHKAEVIEDQLSFEIFSPPRKDFMKT